MILLRKPRVHLGVKGRWWVCVRHTGGFHAEYWPHHLTAMNCALAIARTSRCATPEERKACKPS